MYDVFSLRRVAQELDVRLGDEVGYAIRFEDRTSERTRIKYLTDGVLLCESLSDPELKQYSVIILDEAHERSLNMDILMGLMKRLIKLHASNLKVLITSATPDGEKVAEQPKSYIESSLRKAIDIHVNEPEWDILIFMTWQDDIEKLVSRLEEKIQSLEVGSCMDAVVLPLHGSLPPEMQASCHLRLSTWPIRVFSPPTKDCRRIIVATNIAETSLTVDGVVYVIDSGYLKQRRTRPGKCYRLYPLAVLYLKSLDLPDIDILKFDFLDAPSRKSQPNELPLEPSLARTLIEANKNDCLPQALTVAAMLSVEGTLLPGRSKHTDKKRKQPPSEHPDGSGCSDHIQLLQIYELWDQTDYSTDWVKDNNLQVRGMLFVKNVRKQLCQIMQKFAKGSLDVRRKERRRDRQNDYENLRKSLCVGYASQLAERMIRHNGYRTVGCKSQLVQVHPSSVLRTDDEGMEWMTPILKKLEKLNVKILSGGSNQPEEKTTTDSSYVPKKDVKAAAPADDAQSRIQAARERFLA
ncbi:probable pre-mRNA-splicing factor ATP-dependent RNA helicase DEAH4 isoform X1, partial [Tanacetum coccineum]